MAMGDREGTRNQGCACLPTNASVIRARTVVPGSPAGEYRAESSAREQRKVGAEESTPKRATGLETHGAAV